MIAWVILIIKLFSLQIIKYDYYQGKVIDNIRRETILKAERGEIYDSNMTTLATNYSVYRIFISPRDIVALDKENEEAAKKNGTATPRKTADVIADGLSEILGVDRDEIIKRASKTTRADETIKKNVDEETADKVRAFISENGLNQQIHLEASSARYYPYGSLASNVIGVVGTDGGLIGLELQYDSYLTGVSGRYLTAKNASGLSMPYKYDTYIDASNGANLVTTIDLKMQTALEKQLKQTYEDSLAANRVTGIVMDPKTGAILAMATYPNFDCNSPYVLDEKSQKELDESGLVEGTEEYSKKFSELLYSIWRNKAVSELYEPGSTSKVITASMAFEDNVVKRTDPFFCSGAYKVSGYSKPIHCHKRSGHGSVTFEYGFQQSCNPTFMQVAERIGKESFYNYFKAFGYTGKTGIDLPGEASPLYTPYSSFNQVELAVYSFGQTYKVTALQQLRAICSIANGGYLLTPYVVDKIVDDDGKILMKHETDVVRQVVSKSTCDVVTDILEKGVSGNGGAKNAYVAGYKIAAKTGTSEVRDILNEAGESYLRVGSAVAYAPADDPKIAAIIVVDQPQCASVYGSVVAAPYISNLMDELLPYIGIERNYTEAEMQRLAVTARSYTGWPVADAKKAIKNLGITCEIKGDGDVVNYQIPAAGTSFNKATGKIILYTGEASPVADVTVPKLIGMTAKNANLALASRGLNINIEGSTNDSSATAYVVSQSPAEGTVVDSGSTVTITLRYLDGTA